MIKPNYKDGSIVNLMSSILRHFGSKSKYKPLKIFPDDSLKNSKNIVLIVIDGLGFEFLKKKKKEKIYFYKKFSRTFKFCISINNSNSNKNPPNGIASSTACYYRLVYESQRDWNCF